MTVRRNWDAAIQKLHDEGGICRWCNAYGTEPAHIIARSRVRAGGEDPRNILPLCRPCHTAYDSGSLEILPCLTRAEQVYVVELVGLGEAFRRTTSRERAAA